MIRLKLKTGDIKEMAIAEAQDLINSGMAEHIPPFPGHAQLKKELIDSALWMPTNPIQQGVRSKCL